MDSRLFAEILVLLVVAIPLLWICCRLGLPALLGFMFAGALVGPHAFDWVADPSLYAIPAEIGLVFLLLSIGLEFSLERVRAIRSAVLGAGSLQVLLCTALFSSAVALWGSGPTTALVIGASLALSSTAIVLRIVQDEGSGQQRHGELATGILLFQDLAAVFLLVLLPLLAGSAGEAALLPAFGLAAFRALVLVVVLVAAGRWLLPPLYRAVVRVRSDELLLLTTLAIALVAAWFTHLMHLSMALGGFVIGMMLGESDFRRQIAVDLRPFKDILLGLFFVTLGMQLDTRLLLEYLPRLLLFTLALLTLKAGMIAIALKLLGNTPRVSVKTGLYLAQAGEFGLALMALAQRDGVVPAEQASFIILLALMSMVAGVFLIRHADVLLGWVSGRKQSMTEAPESAAGHVIVGGFGRVGQAVAEAVADAGYPVLAIERDPNLVRTRRKQGHDIHWGDCSRMDVLAACHADRAALLVLTVESEAAGNALLEELARRYPGLPVLLRSRDAHSGGGLLLAASHEWIGEMEDTRSRMSRRALEMLSLHTGGV